MRSSNGCWTCRLRRKKCDETLPSCASCAALLIACYYSNDRPEWMDGGLLQAARAEQVKQEIKARAPFRLRGSAAQQGNVSTTPAEPVLSVARSTAAAMINIGLSASPADIHYLTNGTARTSRDHGLDATEHLGCGEERQNERSPSTARSSTQDDDHIPLHSSRVRGADIAMKRPDALMTTHFLDFVVPFLFPCYELPPVQKGRSWILELLLSSPLIRQSAAYQSDFYLSLTAGGAQYGEGFGILQQRTEIFSTMRRALQRLIDSGLLGEHLFGAARVMIGMVHWMHFELAALGYEAWQTHLGTAAALFEEILKSVAVRGGSSPTTILSDVFDHLGSYSTGGALGNVEIPNAEQVGMRFATAVLLFDDIIASTVLGTAPKLRRYHDCLLGGAAPLLDIQSSIGCQGWVPLRIGDISMLCAWRTSSPCSGTFNAHEFESRAMSIKASIERCLATLEAGEVTDDTNGFEYPLFNSSVDGSLARDRRPYITQIWAYAALLYLHVAVSGWHCRGPEVLHLVNLTITSLLRHIRQLAVLRTLMWPLCVAGFLAEPAGQAQIRRLLDRMKPTHLFPVASKAQHLLERAWRQHSAGLASMQDFGSAFKDDDVILLFL